MDHGIAGIDLFANQQLLADVRNDYRIQRLQLHGWVVGERLGGIQELPIPVLDAGRLRDYEKHAVI
jgi:hypothetical protein